MSIDYSVHLACDVKLKLGDGDALVGEGDLLRRLKAQGRAKILRKIAKEKGKDVKTMRATVKESDDQGQPQTVEIAYTELLQEIEPLLSLQSFCDKCPANALQRPFGCQGAVKYPIRKKSEQWLMQQVQPLDTVAGPYLIHAFADDEGGLEEIQGMRAARIVRVCTPCTQGGRRRAVIEDRDRFRCRARDVPRPGRCARPQLLRHAPAGIGSDHGGRTTRNFCRGFRCCHRNG